MSFYRNITEQYLVNLGKLAEQQKHQPVFENKNKNL